MLNSIDIYKGIFLNVIPVRIIAPWWNVIEWNHIAENPLWGKRKGETECRFIRDKNKVKHSIWLDQILNKFKLSKFYTKIY